MEVGEEGLVLYRKYRPRGFDEVVGQESVVRALSNALATGRVAHAYLFSGPHGVGKTTVARLVAKAVNCAALANASPAASAKSHARQNRDGGVSIPCNKCASCVRYNDGTALDIIEIDAASNRGIDEIRELRDVVRYATSHGGKKTYIIDEVHMLTSPAFNALLKTLEEPPAHAIFVLATTEIDRVPATIISRTQHYQFRRPRLEEISARLEMIAKKEGTALEPRAAHMIAVASAGSMRDAESILGQIMAAEPARIGEGEVEMILGLPRRELIWKLFRALAARDSAEAIALVRASAAEGHDIGQVLKALIQVARNAVFAKLDQRLKEMVAEDMLPEDREALEAVAAATDLVQLKRILGLLTEAAPRLRRSPIAELPLELAALEISLQDKSI